MIRLIFPYKEHVQVDQQIQRHSVQLYLLIQGKLHRLVSLQPITIILRIILHMVLLIERWRGRYPKFIDKNLSYR